MRQLAVLVPLLVTAAMLAGCSEDRVSYQGDTAPTLDGQQSAEESETSAEPGDVYEQAAELLSSSDREQTIAVWRPTWLPEGFEMTRSELTWTRLFVEYMRDQDVIALHLGLGDYGDESGLETATAVWGDAHAVLILNDSFYSAPGGVDRACLTVRGPSGPLQAIGISREELLHIAESMELVE